MLLAQQEQKVYGYGKRAWKQTGTVTFYFIA